MLFHSFTFLIFFIIVYSLYLFSNHAWQNRILLCASFIFYGWWDWRFLFLLWFSTSVDYVCAAQIYKEENHVKKKFLLILSIAINLSILFFFKYFNFFTENVVSLVQVFGFRLGWTTLHVILPIGISFYTFQAISYVIDVYRGTMTPISRLDDFMLYVVFFPQLIAGPIERANHLVPQLQSPRFISLDQIYEGSYLFFWGLFQKIFVADNLSFLVESVFNSKPPYNAVAVLLASYAFTIQIYCDFAGYSNMARGLGKWMGFDIMVNFKFPFFSTNPYELWQRWHISLSTWFRDYLYKPLTRNRRKNWIIFGSAAITMILGGLWHGARWTYVLWGVYHGFLIIVYGLIRPLPQKPFFWKSSMLSSVWFWAKVIFFFHCFAFGGLIFRAISISQVFQMSKSLLVGWHAGFNNWGMISSFRQFVFFTFILMGVEFLQFKKDDVFVIWRLGLFPKTIFYLVCFYGLLVFGIHGAKEFVYFQF